MCACRAYFQIPVLVKKVIQAKLNQLRASTFFRNVATLVSGSALAQLVGLACAPILTRLYTPEEFGLLGIFMAVSAVAATIATLRYDLAIILPRKDASAWSLLRLAGSWTIVAVLLALIVLYPLRYSLAELVDAPGLARYFVWLPLLVLTSGWLSLATHWGIRKKRFRALSTTAVSTCVLGNSYKIGGGLMGFGGGVLIVGTFIQQAVHLAVLAFQLRKEIPAEPYDSAEAWAQAREHRSFPLYRMPQDALASFAYNLPNLLLAAYFSPVVVGFFLLAHRVVQAPIGLIREAVRQVFYQQATELHHAGVDLLRATIRMTLGLGAICVPLVALLWLLGPQFFGFVFGAEWAIAGSYAQPLALMVAAAVCNTPSVVVIPIIGKNAGLLIYELFATGLRVCALILGGLFLSAHTTVWIFCLVSAFANLCLITWVLKSLKSRKNEQSTS